MSKILFNGKTVKIHCLNCNNDVIGIQDDKGLTKIKCPKCGSVTISRIMGRRHVRVDIYAPKGEEIID